MKVVAVISQIAECNHTRVEHIRWNRDRNRVLTIVPILFNWVIRLRLLQKPRV